ncbi:putative domain HDIG [Sedimentisphaera salicampi]|uniref:Putative domain HDIG n=2 Tax=Sedimentisphaera salicampi TaxID=1941349 RepID=A0A1W6LP21_9BACT|nr:putative domain HDIG [Sedimentisphaera salicampi]
MAPAIDFWNKLEHPGFSFKMLFWPESLIMKIFRKKVNARRKQVRNTRAAERASKYNEFVRQGYMAAVITAVIFAFLCSAVLSFSVEGSLVRIAGPAEFLAYFALMLLITAGMGVYTYLFRPRIIRKRARLLALTGLLLLLLFIAKTGSGSEEWVYLTTGTGVVSAMILTITYSQRYSLTISLLYALMASFVLPGQEAVELFLTMVAGIFACCFTMKEIRNRWKLIQVSMFAAICVMAVSVSMGVINRLEGLEVVQRAGTAALSTFFVGVIIQGILPVIEKVFGVVTSMTLLDYSDANQPLLKKLAMEAPGTYSHSLLLGSLAENAAEAIGANGLLCRVGAYYHDIGKTNKPKYFVENQMGQANKHDTITPAMSQLVIVGHVKDGIEIAKEYNLPPAIRQFIETHHGTTIIKYFYEEAKKQRGEENVSEDDFRYPGPKPSTREAAILMLCDGTEGATRALSEPTPSKISAVVHNILMSRLRDGQFNDCEITIKELSKIEKALVKSLTAHYHGRVKYPEDKDEEKKAENGNGGNGNKHSTSESQPQREAIQKPD